MIRIQRNDFNASVKFDKFYDPHFLYWYPETTHLRYIPLKGADLVVAFADVEDCSPMDIAETGGALTGREKSSITDPLLPEFRSVGLCFDFFYQKREYNHYISYHYW